MEAFDLANDPKAFPEQLKYVSAWKPRRVFWNAWLPALQNATDGSFKNSIAKSWRVQFLLGKSYTEISALSRSMHKSQGFGSSGIRNNIIKLFYAAKR
ncbi:MAG: hypothetical protein MZV64_46615 [Ignavibacteriales bacterium]|nr:hypothetical protein [Ignavibacteriales bacterium]